MTRAIHSDGQFTAMFKAARRVSTPLIAVRTPDPSLAVQRIAEAVAVPGNGSAPPLIGWDVLRGFWPRNQAGRAALQEALGDREAASFGPTEALAVAAEFAEDSVLLYSNAQRFWNETPVMQAIWNLRDTFKTDGRLLALLTTPGATLPEELAQDVLVLDEPLPAEPDLAAIARETCGAANLPEPDQAATGRIVDALLGLAAFPAEQVLAMSIDKDGVNADQLWNRKRQVIEQTPGLTVWRGGETFQDVGGCENVKHFLRAVMSGRDAPRGVVFIDEIEKAFAGTGTDLSGVKTEMTGAILTWMQDHQAEGCLFLGPAGTAKSAVSKAAGNTAGVPTIAFDLGAMQGSLVGESGARLRAALKVVEAVTNGRSLWIATCNSICTLPPELRRRFTLGTFFFDLPTAEEQASIWTIYQEKYGVSGPLPDDEGWTGAEIKECCRKAWRLGLTLEESARYIVPVSRSAAEQIKALRQQASGKFISASVSGVYQYEDVVTSARTGRVFRSGAGGPSMRSAGL
jgi:hypothetical protein